MLKKSLKKFRVAPAFHGGGGGGGGGVEGLKAKNILKTHTFFFRTLCLYFQYLRWLILCTSNDTHNMEEFIHYRWDSEGINLSQLQ